MVIMCGTIPAFNVLCHVFVQDENGLRHAPGALVARLRKLAISEAWLSTYVPKHFGKLRKFVPNFV